MKRLVWLSLATLVAMFSASAVTAQSLADIAKKEKERRKNLKSPESETVTDVELRRAGGPRILTSPTRQSETDGEGGSDTDAEDNTDGESDEPVDERQTQDYWQGRLRPIDERIQRLEQQLASPEMTANPRGAAARQDVEERLARARAERQTIVTEARRKGVPPGWLR